MAAAPRRRLQGRGCLAACPGKLRVREDSQTRAGTSELLQRTSLSKTMKAIGAPSFAIGFVGPRAYRRGLRGALGEHTRAASSTGLP